MRNSIHFYDWVELKLLSGGRIFRPCGWNGRPCEVMCVSSSLLFLVIVERSPPPTPVCQNCTLLKPHQLWCIVAPVVGEMVWRVHWIGIPLTWTRRPSRWLRELVFMIVQCTFSQSLNPFFCHQMRVREAEFEEDLQKLKRQMTEGQR